MEQKKKRLVYLDALRIIAIMCVIFNHSGVNGFLLYTTTDNVYVQFISIFISSFSKIGVPLFFMISGALLLDKDESLKDLLIKRVLRYVIILFVFCGLNFLYKVHLGMITFNFADMIRKTTTGQMHTPYWFLYSYIGFLLTLTILRKLVKVMTNSDYYYLFALYVIVCGVFGLFARTFIGELNIPVALAADTVVYPLLGYFLAYRTDKSMFNKFFVSALMCAAIAGLLLNDLITSFDYRHFGGWTESALSLFIIFAAAFVFSLSKYFFENVSIPHWLESMITTLGSCVFGVYLLECYVKDYFGFIQQYLYLIIPKPIASLIYLFCILFIGSGITFILRKIPIIKKLFI